MNYLEEMLKNIKNEVVYIQTHNFPDPDAIACAFGLTELLAVKGVKAEICYKGNIERTVTAKMVRLLGINVKEYHLTENFKDDDEVILVDSQKGNANIIDMRGNKIICIDHHPVYENGTYRFSDIRPEIGACASIIASYYYENGITMSENVTTALLYGIKMDTDNLRRGVSQLDLDMFYKLYENANKDIIAELDRGVLYFDDIQAYKHAFNTIDVVDDICFANAGDECKEALIAAICDFLVNLDGVNLAVVQSPKRDGIKLSIRSSGKYLAGVMTAKALKNIGTGGGHDNMAGGFVPYGRSADTVSKEDVIHLENEIKERFLYQVKLFTQSNA